jgi:hypothetical protein
MQPQDRHLFLLGPQPSYESLQLVLQELQLDSPVALITAGWEAEEDQDQALKNSLGVEAINLNLFARSEQLFADDQELIQLLRDRQDELRHLRDAYNDRLHLLLKAARQVIRRQESLVDLTAERESAIDMVRQLDRQYYVRTSQIHDRYEERLQTAHRPLVAQQRREINGLLDQSKAILIAGGHVAIILNRLKIFGILEMRPDLPIIAWSGGAMALSDQIVFFHDSPPQGPGDPELLRAGIGLFSDILPLPDAKSRLNLGDSARVELFARRFEHFRCVIFDEHTILERKDEHWLAKGTEPLTKLGHSGGVMEFNA